MGRAETPLATRDAWHVRFNGLDACHARRGAPGRRAEPESPFRRHWTASAGGRKTVPRGLPWSPDPVSARLARGRVNSTDVLDMFHLPDPLSGMTRSGPCRNVESVEIRARNTADVRPERRRQRVRLTSGRALLASVARRDGLARSARRPGAPLRAWQASRPLRFPTLAAAAEPDFILRGSEAPSGSEAAEPLALPGHQPHNRGSP